MKGIINLYILFAFFTLLLLGCSQKEINYYSNPHVVILQKEIDSAEVGDYQISIIDSELILYYKNKKMEVSLPDNYSDIQSLHFSYDKQFLAFDVKVDSGIKIFVVNLETGEMVNLSETIGYKYDYDGYHSPFGIAWSPNKNLIAIIGGYIDSARINLYHFEMENGKQAPGGSFAFKDVYALKWDNTGESIYYLVDSLENENMYQIYQTEIESNSYLRGGTVNIITEINLEGFNNWLK